MAEIAAPRLCDLLIFIELQFPIHLFHTSLAKLMKGHFLLFLESLGIELNLESGFVLMFLGSLRAAVVHGFLQPIIIKDYKEILGAINANW